MKFGNDQRVTSELSETLKNAGLNEVSTHTLGDVICTGKHVIILQTAGMSLRNISPEDFDSLKASLLCATEVLWVYSQDQPESMMSIGLARSIRSETMRKIAMLGLQNSELDSVQPSKLIMRTLFELWLGGDDKSCKDMEFTSRDGELFVQRIQEDVSMNAFVSNETRSAVLENQPFFQNGRRLKIQIGNPGALDTLHWTDDSPTKELGDEEVEIEVKATGCNFKDIVAAMGQLAQPYIGVECSGVVSAKGKDVSNVEIGQRVMAMTPGAYSTYTRCLGSSVFSIASTMTLEEAASIPVVFCTAYYGLFDLGQLVKGESVLIHAAAGGVGQAAIMLAKMVGVDIYATVGSKEKQQFLVEKYGIPENRILYSRDTSFGADIRLATAQRGVDVVLNSLAGDILRETWNCLAPFGRFVEIGKADITRNSHLDMMKFEHNCTFASVDLTKVAAQKPTLMQRLLANVCGLLEKGVIEPIRPIKVYSISETENAFRALQSGKSMGKLIVSSDPEGIVMATKPKIKSDLFPADATYVIVGGTGGLGRSLTKWMSSKGARSIVLVSRSASVSPEVRELMDQLSPQGTRITVRPCDVSDLESVRTLAEGLQDLPPIRGIVHAAMVLKDVLFEQMTFSDFCTVTASKVDGAMNLHHALSASPLDFFVAFSSVAGIIGNRGQAAYAAANVFLDGFMAFRRAQGLPGTSIDLTAVSNVGYLADNGETRRAEILKNIGGQTVDESEVIALFAAAVTGQMDSTCDGQCVTGLDVGPGEQPFWLSDAKFADLADRAASTEVGGGGPAISLSKAIRTAASREDAENVLYDALASRLAAMLLIAVDAIDPGMSMKSLGLDSLVAIEVRNWIVRETEVNVQVLELLDAGSVKQLAGVILGKMGVQF